MTREDIGAEQTAHFELQFTQWQPKGSRWKPVSLKRVFSAASRAAGTARAQTEWDTICAKGRHRLPTFHALLIRIDWDPCRDQRPIGNSRHGKKRYFLLRYFLRHTQRGGSVKETRSREFCAGSLSIAYTEASRLWTARRHKLGESCSFIGLFEKLDWQPKDQGIA